MVDGIVLPTTIAVKWPWLLVITCYNWLFLWGHTFYKWGVLSTYSFIVGILGHNCVNLTIFRHRKRHKKWSRPRPWARWVHRRIAPGTMHP